VGGGGGVLWGVGVSRTRKEQKKQGMWTGEGGGGRETAAADRGRKRSTTRQKIKHHETGDAQKGTETGGSARDIPTQKDTPVKQKKRRTSEVKTSDYRAPN